LLSYGSYISYYIQDARAAVKIKRNKLLDTSYNILYTWTAAGDGGIYYREEHVGGTRPWPVVFCERCMWGGTHPGGRFFKKKTSSVGSV